jgi:hypothetical protein
MRFRVPPLIINKKSLTITVRLFCYDTLALFNKPPFDSPSTGSGCTQGMLRQAQDAAQETGVIAAYN